MAGCGPAARQRAGGPDPAISIRRAGTCISNRDRRDKPGMTTERVSKPELEPQLKYQCVPDGGVGIWMDDVLQVRLPSD